MKPFPTGLTFMLLAAAIWSALFGAIAPPPALTAPSTYQLNLPLVYGAGSPTPTLTCTPIIDPTFEQRVIELVNQERTSRGLATLKKSPALMDAARGHSEDMACNDFVDHTGSDGSTPRDRILRAGYTPGALGENIAAGCSTPEQVVDIWMKSDGHRANILNPDYCHIGVGYAYNANATYGHYWTQDMATPAEADV